MTRHRLTSSVSGALAVLALATTLSAQSVIFRPGPPTEPHGGFLFSVMLDTGEDAQLVADQFDATIVASNMMSNLHLMRAPEGLTPSEKNALVQDVNALPEVVFSEIDHLVNLPNTGGCTVGQGQIAPQQCTIPFVDGTPTMGEFYGQPGLKSIKYTWANWLADQYIEPGPAVVAVIDTGLDFDHPVFEDQIHDLGYDFLLEQPGGYEVADGLDNDFDGLVDEAHGHGTHVSSSIALINPHAEILPLRALDAEGNGTAFGLACAIFYAVDHGADLINLSVSMTSPSLCVAAAIEYAEYAGVPIITSAGNTGLQSTEVLFPANYKPSMLGVLLPFLPGWYTPHAEVVSVAGVDDDNHKADFSAHGPQVSVVAPAVDVYGAMPGGGFAWWSGTSQACAVASGVASLVVSVGEGLPEGLPVPMVDLLMSTAQNIDPLNPGLTGQLGSGRVDAWFAAAAVLFNLPPGNPAGD